jgi:1,4-alpha-glucan branching enzyme
MRKSRFMLSLLGALVASGCAGSGSAPVDATVPSAAFVAPDGAKATPNTGASRLADGLGSGIDAPLTPAAAAPSATAAGGPAPAAVSGDGVVFTWTGGGSSVNVAGDFNAWSADADPMVKQADGSFRLVKKLEPGRYAYKFVVDGQWKPDPAAKETVDDGFGGKNSLVVVGTGGAGTAVAASSTVVAPVPAAGGPTTSADGAVFTYKGPGSAVTVAGEWNGWDMAADPMVKQADGTFRLVKKLEPGRYPYKFVVDGQWTTDPSATETVDDGFGGKNAVIVVGPAAGGAATATPAPATGAGAAAAAGVGAGRAPEVTPQGVRFTFGGTAAKTVHLAGDFNGWSVTTDPLTRGADGAWSIVKALPAGTHAYKFVVDGTTWKPDDANPASADDGFGGKNSIVTVP